MFKLHVNSKDVLTVFLASAAGLLIGKTNGLLFPITATGVVSCGGPKTLPRTSSIVQIIFLLFGPLRSAGLL